MHPWHDCYVDDYSVEKSFPVVIEVPKGSKNMRLIREALMLYQQLRRGELKQA
jgi:hypothetical protein